jgi:hypothetical protein
MMNTRLNWSSFIKFWSDQSGVVKFSWRDSQIRKAYLESVNSISAIKTADRLPGSDLFNDDFPSPKHFTPSDETKQYEESSTETLVVDNNNIPIQDVPEEPIENDDNKQSRDSNRDSWISMKEISFLESFTSKISNKFDKKTTQQKSESLFEDFLDDDIKTKSSTPPVNNSRIDSVIAKIGRNSTNLTAKLGSLKSHVFGSNGTLIPIKENSSSSVKHPVVVNLLDDSINDAIISKETNEKKNSSGLLITPAKNKTISNFGDIGLDSQPLDDLNQQSFFSNFNDQSSTIKNNTVNTKLNDDDTLLNFEKMANKKNNSSLTSESDLANNDNDLGNLGNQKQEDNWIFSTDLSFFESNNTKPSSSNSRKSQQNSFFDFSEFELNLSSIVQPVQPQKASDTFLQSIIKLDNDISKVKEEKQENQKPNNTSNLNFKHLYTPSMNVSSTSISSEFGEMVSANDTENQNLNDDWMLNTSTNKDNWISSSGLSFLETLKTSSNNNYHNNQKSKQTFGDLDEFITF